MMPVCLVCCHLFGFVGAQTREHLIEIHLVGIELGSVHTHEAHLAAYGDTACTTHTRAVHHNSVEAGICGDIVLRCGQGHEFHHDCRSDGDALVHMFAVDDLLHAHGYHAFLSERAVVGHHYHLVGSCCQLLTQDNEFGSTCRQHCDDTIARPLEGLRNGQHRCCSHTATGTDYRAKMLYISCLAQWTNQVSHLVAYVECHQFGTADTDTLHDKSDGAFFYVGIGNG